MVIALAVSVSGKPSTFFEDFKVTWADSHITQLEGGRAIQLLLDQNSGLVGSILFNYLNILRILNHLNMVYNYTYS